MSKLSLKNFYGMLPIKAPDMLPDGFADTAVNCKLSSGNLEAYPDLGNSYQLAKSAVINTIARLSGFWLQWSQLEIVAPAVDVDVTLGTVPDDPSGRTYFTGTGLPRVTTTFYATDPSEQGANPLHAYPYVSYPLGVVNPVTAPTVYTPPGGGIVAAYGYAQPTSVNNAVLTAPGTAYKEKDVLTLVGGTVETNYGPAQITVDTVDANGAILTYSLTNPGFYQAALGPGPTGVAVIGGSGTGAVFSTTDVANTFAGFGTASYDNGAGSYIHWTIAGDNWLVTTGQGDLAAAYSNQNFSLGTAASFELKVVTVINGYSSGAIGDALIEFAGTFDGARNINGPAVVLSAIDSTFKLQNTTAGTNGNAVGGQVVNQVSGLAIGAATLYLIDIKATANSNNADSTSGFNVTATLATVATPNTILATVMGFVSYNGEQIGPASNHRGTANSAAGVQFKDISLVVTQQVNNSNSESVNYVYQWAQQYPGDTATQISGPSDPSQTISVFIDSTTTPATRADVTVTIPAAPTGQFIVDADLFRTVQGTDGSETYVFVARVPVSTASPTIYVDGAQDAAIGPDVLLSQDFAPPPPNLIGIEAGPNGVMAGWIAGTNTVCFSAVNYPYAWPIGNQYPCVAPIVGGAWVDATYFAITQANPYAIYGNEPSNYSMSKEAESRAGVSKRSVAAHRRLGIIYAAGAGLYAYRGQNYLVNLTEAIFSYEQWQALNPSSILGVVFNERYWFWYDTGTVKGGYVLDLSQESKGVISLDFHVTAVYVDPSTDTLYLVPDSSTLPIGGTVVTTAQNKIWQWEGATTLRQYIWGRSEYPLLNRPEAYVLGRVRGQPGNGAVAFTAQSETGTAVNAQAITNSRPFILAPVPGIQWGVSFTGTQTVSGADLAETAEDLLT